MLFWLLAPLVIIFINIGFCRADESTCMDPVFAVLLLYRLMKMNSFSSGGSDSFVSYDLAMATVQSYSAEKTVLMTCQNVDAGL